MIIPDLITVQPTHIDFPLFRYNLKRYRQYFNKIIIALSPGPGIDYSSFFKEVMGGPDIEIFDVEKSLRGDWRNNAVNLALKRVEAPYVLFLEQDFLIRDPRLFEVILRGTMDYNTVSYDEGGRTHPAFALVPVELINQTSKDFAAAPPGYDHFGKFFRELSAIANICDLQDLGLKPEMDFYHMAGVTNNYQRFEEDLELYKPSEFLSYNTQSIKLAIPKPPGFQPIMEQIQEKYGPGKSEMIEGFFPKEVLV